MLLWKKEAFHDLLDLVCHFNVSCIINNPLKQPVEKEVRNPTSCFVNISDPRYFVIGYFVWHCDTRVYRVSDEQCRLHVLSKHCKIPRTQTLLGQFKSDRLCCRKAIAPHLFRKLAVRTCHLRWVHQHTTRSAAPGQTDHTDDSRTSLRSCQKYSFHTRASWA